MDDKFITKLGKVSPALYVVVVAVLGVASAFTIYKTMFGDAIKPDYPELVGFVLFGIFLMAIGSLLKFINRKEIPRIVFSSIVVVIGMGWYLISSGVLNLGAAPTIYSEPFLTEFISGTETPLDAEAISDIEALDLGSTDIPSPVGNTRAYVQYAGIILREDIVEFSRKLVEAGWNIPDYEDGDYRTEKAKDLNVVRYFYEQDRENAERLAQAVQLVGGPNGSGSNMQIQYLGDAFQPKAGSLEIWISN